MSSNAANELPTAVPLPKDDKEFDRALGELDVKLSAWTRAMVRARSVLQKKVAGRPAAAVTAFEEPQAPPSIDAPLATGHTIAPQAAEEPISILKDSANFGETEEAVSSEATVVVEQWPSRDAPAEGGGGASADDEMVSVAWPEKLEQSEEPEVEPVPPTEIQPEPGPAVGVRESKPRLSEEEERRIREEEEALLASVDPYIAKRLRRIKRMNPDARLHEMAKKIESEQEEAEGEKGKKESWWRKK